MENFNSNWRKRAAKTHDDLKKDKLNTFLSTKYQDRPFEQRNAGWRLLALCTSFGAHGITILASASFVFSWLAGVFSGVPYPAALAALTTGIVLFGVEYAKRKAIRGGWFDYYDPGFDMQEGFMQAGRLVFIAALLGLDLFFAWNGSFDLVRQVNNEPVYMAPALTDNAVITGHYKPLITQAEKEAESFKKSATYLGKLSDRDRRTYNNLLQRRADLVTEMNFRLSQNDSTNAATTAAALADFDKAKQEHAATMENKGHGLAVISFFMFPLLILCLWYLEFFDFQVWMQYRGKSGLSAPTLSDNIYQNGHGIGFNAITNRQKSVSTTSTALTGGEIPAAGRDPLDIWKDALSGCQREKANIQNGHGAAATVWNRYREHYKNLLKVTPVCEERLNPRQVEAMEKVINFFIQNGAIAK